MLLLFNIVENAEIGRSSSNCKNKTIKRLFFMNLNRIAIYLTLKTRLAFTWLEKTFTKASIIWHFDLN